MSPPIPVPKAAPVAGLLPTYALYGEPGRTQATDWLHCERIAERSQRHDWEIRPHRHAALVQILHIARGTAQAWLDGRSQPLAGPCVLLMPALVPHGFVFAPDIDGTVVTVLEQHLSRLLAGTPALAAQPEAAGGRELSELSALGLTERQIEVLGYVVQGLRNKEIARVLDRSEVVVKKHVTATLQALGAPNRTKLLVLLSQRGYRVPSMRAGADAGADD